MDELRSRKIGCIYFNYCIYEQHCDTETLSYIVENFQRIKFCGLNMHSKGAYLLNSTSKVDFEIENNPSVCLVDFLGAVLRNSVQTNNPHCYLSLYYQKR